MTNIQEVIKQARHYLRMGNESAYQREMIVSIRESMDDETTEILLKAGLKDGYAFKHFGIRSKV
jgi:hypothetical protein|tara:strand:- start:729 stop:920 length:192 start_codon:yes stop_codon:yes gene_type:complete